MTFTTLKIPGTAAIETLELRRLDYRQTGEYPFLIGDAEELERIREAAEYNAQNFDDLIRESLNLDLSNWLRGRRGKGDGRGKGDAAH